MAQLSKVADTTRSVVKVIAIGVAGLILLFVIFQVGMLIKNIIAPTPPTPPTVAFGKLKELILPTNIDGKNYTYTINTLSGSLPTLPDRITVYKLQQATPNLLSLDNANSIAAASGFTATPTAQSDILYQWDKTDPLPMTLTMNIQSLDFTLTSQYQTNSAITSAASAPDETQSQTVSSDFFSSLVPLPSYIDSSKTKLTLFALTPSGGLTPASSVSTAQLLRIDYFPQDISGIPIYTSNPTQSLIYSLVANGNNNYPEVVEASYYHKAVDTSEKATYPIITAQEAYKELQQGKGYIAANPNSATNITITNITLGYYVDTTNQPYLWPIIVFQGDTGFYAYVSAIDPQWISN